MHRRFSVSDTGQDIPVMLRVPNMDAHRSFLDRGAHIAVSVMFKILETQMNMPHPLAIMLNYAALDFNFTSWMTPQNLKVLQAEQSSGHLSLLPDQKDHLRHISPLSMVAPRRLRRKSSLGDTLRQWTGSSSAKSIPQLRHRHTTTDVRELLLKEDAGAVADTEDESLSQLDEDDRPVGTRIRFNPEVSQVHVQRAVDSPSPMDMEEEHEARAAAVEARAPIGTRLTMTSRTGYFQDRIIPPSMVSLPSEQKRQQHQHQVPLLQQYSSGTALPYPAHRLSLSSHHTRPIDID